MDQWIMPDWKIIVDVICVECLEKEAGEELVIWVSKPQTRRKIY